MNQDESNGRKSQDNKPSGQSVLLYIVAAAIGVTLLVMLFVKSSAFVISYQQLLELLDANQKPAAKSTNTPAESSSSASEKERAPSGSIEFEQPRSNGSPRLVRLSNLRDIKIGDRVVRGMVDIEYPNEPRGNSNPQHGVAFQTYKTDSDTVEAQLVAKLQNSTLDWSNDPEPSPWRAYMPMLVFTGVLILFFIVMMRRLGGAGSPMQFGRSRGKLYALEDLGVTFDDVAGIDEAVEEVREVVDFLRSPDKYQRLGGRIPKGVLLVGPPGTGKTLLSQSDRRRSWRAVLQFIGQ